MDMQTAAVIGLGALGTIYASVLTEGLGMENAWVIADPVRSARYEKEGVYFNGRRLTLRYVAPGPDAPQADLIIVATKNHHLPQAIEDMRPFVGAKTQILSVLNGVESEERLAAAYGWDRVIRTVAFGMSAVKMGTNLECENIGYVTFGEDDGTVSPRVQAVHQLFDRVGLPHIVSEDILHRQWGKLMCNTGGNQATAAFNCNYGDIQKPGEPRDYMIAAMKEVMAVSPYGGATLTQADLADWLKVMDGLNPAGTSSMCQDVRLGRKTEVEVFGETIQKLGRAHGIPTPANDFLVHKIKELEAQMHQ